MKVTSYFLRLGRLLCLTLFVVGVVGCGRGGDGLERASVRGRVVLNDQPVDGGSISFIALDSANPNIGASITDGLYEVPRERGPAPGKYRVEIYWERPLRPLPEGEQFDDAAPPPETRQVIPASYNQASTLEVEIEPGENTHDFAIESP